MIIFKSLLTTFEVSFDFWDSTGSSGKWLEPKTKLPYNQVYPAYTR